MIGTIIQMENSSYHCAVRVAFRACHLAWPASPGLREERTVASHDFPRQRGYVTSFDPDNEPDFEQRVEQVPG